MQSEMQRRPIEEPSWFDYKREKAYHESIIAGLTSDLMHGNITRERYKFLTEYHLELIKKYESKIYERH